MADDPHLPEPSPPPVPPMLAVVRDLLFLSRIVAAGRRVGVPVRVLRDPALLRDDTVGRGVIADLDLPGAAEAAAAWKRSTGRPAGGFAPHVRADVLRAARDAGLDPVVPRSRLDAALPALFAAGG